MDLRPPRLRVRRYYDHPSSLSGRREIDGPRSRGRWCKGPYAELEKALALRHLAATEREAGIRTVSQHRVTCAGPHTRSRHQERTGQADGALLHHVNIEVLRL